MEPIITPSLRVGRSVISYSFDVLLIIACLTVYSYVIYGLRPVLLTLITIGTAMLCEAIACLLSRRRLTFGDGTALVTGGLIAMMMSPITPVWAAMAAAAFAIWVAKMPFGGSGRNIFNPAAAGVAFATFCFPRSVLTYPNPDQGLRLLWDTTAVIPQESVASVLKSGGASFETPMNMLFGNTPGAIGATTILVLLAGLIYLACRRTVSLHAFIPYVLTCAVIALVFPRTGGNLLNGVFLELTSGLLLFGGIFMLNDPTTTPHHASGRVIFGILTGIAVMLMRHFGRFEDGVCFAILLMNPLSSVIDRAAWQVSHFVEKRWLHRV
ncbi:MAG: RnfABCDGE type electron transport complex subunit D [Clostridia bacterium]|nr:RnfABCDGE type electron transport complex subunit D [Clostridia bacterium]